MLHARTSVDYMALARPSGSRALLATGPPRRTLASWQPLKSVFIGELKYIEAAKGPLLGPTRGANVQNMVQNRVATALDSCTWGWGLGGASGGGGGHTM